MKPLGKYIKHTFTTALVLIFWANASAQVQKLLLDYPIITQTQINEHNLLTESDSIINSPIQIKIYKWLNYTDSESVCTLNMPSVSIPKGIGKQSIQKEWKDVDRSFEDYLYTIKLIDNFPPGDYIIVSNIQNTSQSFTNYWKIDSVLKKDCKLRNLISDSYSSTLNSIQGGIQKVNNLKISPEMILQKSERLMNTSMTDFKNHIQEKIASNFPDIKTKFEISGQEQVIHLFYKKIYLGKYEWNLKEDVKQKAKESASKLYQSSKTYVKESVNNYRTLYEEYKEKKIKESKSDHIKGRITLDNYFNSDQEEYSENDNIYSEVYGDLRMKLYGIPIRLEGYFTTQDLHRSIRSSYLKIEYDFSTAKQDMEENLNHFKQDLNEKKSKVFGIHSIYSSYLNNIDSKKEGWINDLKSDFDVSQISHYSWDDISQNPNLLNEIDTNRIVQLITQKAEQAIDSNETASKTKEKYLKAKEKAQKAIAKLQKAYAMYKEVEVQYNKYKSLLDQANNSLHFDTTMVLSKIKGETNMQDLSYNGLLKKGKELLPKYDLSKYTKNIKEFKIGILNNYESDYTMAGQTMKGGTIKYGLGKTDIGIFGGRVEYVSRDFTNMDTYLGYGISLQSELSQTQKIGIIYYAYSPSKNQLSKDFYRNIKNNFSAFHSPTSITALTYQGKPFKSMDFEMEVARSFNKSYYDEKITQFSLDNMSYKGSLDYRPNKLPFGTTLTYESIGQNFLNETLPFIRKGVSLIHSSVDGEFFKGFIRAKVSFDQLLRNPQYGTVKNQKWGFEIRTVSRQYPTILISYKPFSTFSSLNDTFAVDQRPLFGDVFMSKISYQLKRKKASHRWQILYNRNNSNMDTTNYETNLFQASYLYNSKKLNGTLQTGRMKMPEGFSAPNNQMNYFIRITEQSRQIKSLPLQLGQEVAWSKNQIVKLGLQLGTSYALKKIPLSIRLQGRYMYYINSLNEKKNIWGSCIGLSYAFQMKNIHAWE